MLRKYVSCAALCVGLATSFGPAPAEAGVVIVDGRVADALGKMPTPPPSNIQKPLSRDEQELWLWAALVFGGHEAADEGGLVLGTADTEGTADLEVDEASAAGCNGAEGSVLAAIVALFSLRRRRR